MKIHLFVFWLAFFISIWKTNAQVTTSQLLSGPIENHQPELATTYFNRLSSMNYRLPWVDKLEFRTETERLLTSRQEFLFRTSFNSFSQKKYEVLKHQSLVERKIADFQKRKYEQVNQRYMDILEIAGWQSEKNNLLHRLHYHQKLDSIFRFQLSGGENINLPDFLKNRKEWLEVEKKVEERKIFIKNKLGQLGFEGNDSLTFFNRVTVETMFKNMQNFTDDIGQHPELLELDAETRYYDNELLVEKSKEKKILDFAQVRYNVRDDLLLQNQFSVGVGLNIPWRGSSKLRYQNITVKQLETQFEKSLTCWIYKMH